MNNLLSGLNKDFIKIVFKLALPVSLQQAFTASLSLIDVLMVGQLGVIELASVGLVNKILFVIIMFTGGIASGAGVLTAQYHGAKNQEGYRNALAVSIILICLITIPLGFISYLFPSGVMSIITEDPFILEKSSKYLYLTSPFHLLSGITMVFGAVVRSIEKPHLPMVAGIIGIASNTLLNYLLIFGHYGFPSLGIEGAAIATVISRMLELVIFIGILYYQKVPIFFYSIKGFIGRLTKLNFSRLLRPTISIVGGQTSWAVGIFVYFIIYGKIGSDELAAMSMLEPVEGIFIHLFFGFGSAAGIILGNRLGANDFTKAYQQARVFAVLMPVAGLFAGLCLFLGKGLIFAFFSNIDTHVLELADNILNIMSIMLAFKFFNMVNMIGILRSGGDTKYAWFIDGISMWVIGVPLAVIGGIFLKLPLELVYLLVTGEEMMKMFLGQRRFRSKKWMRNIIS